MTSCSISAVPMAHKTGVSGNLLIAAEDVLLIDDRSERWASVLQSGENKTKHISVEDLFFSPSNGVQMRTNLSGRQLHDLIWPFSGLMPSRMIDVRRVRALTTDRRNWYIRI